MNKKHLLCMFCAGLFSAALLSGVVLADGVTTQQAAAEAKQQPVVAPVPSGTNPADPGVSSASPADDVSVSSPTVISTNSPTTGN